jgi:hypothetical protein
MNINKIPANILNIIYQLLDNDSKNNYSFVTKYFRSIYIKNIKEICLDGNNTQIIPHERFVDYMASYSNIQKFIFKCFSMKHIYYINKLIINLQQNPNLLCNIKELVFYNIEDEKYDFKDTKYFDDLQKLNDTLLELLIHTNLKSIRINGIIKHNIFKNCLLKKIKVTSTGDISFEDQKELLSIKLYNFEGTMDTIESLKNCYNLEKFMVKDTHGNNSINIEVLNFITCANFWPNLKRLELTNILINRTEKLIKILNNFPHLEYLNINTANNKNYEIINKQCPNLYALVFNCSEKIDITNTNIFPQLKMLVLGLSYNIKDNKFIHITQNCPNLRVLSIFALGKSNIIKIDNNIIKTLINNCPNLQSICIIGVNFRILGEDLYYLINNLPNLKNFILKYDGSDIAYNINEKTLSIKYPHINFEKSMNYKQII